MSAGTSLTQGKLTVIDTEDGDLATDGRAGEERPEIITVNGQQTDFTGYYNAGDPALLSPQAVGDAVGVAQSVIGLLQALIPDPVDETMGLLAVANEVVTAAIIVYQHAANIDPYDANYHTVYQPPAINLPSLPSSAATLPVNFQTDAQHYLQALADTASYSKALFVTQNRMLSAIQDGDEAAFTLQNAQLNKYSALLGASETNLSQATTTYANDVAALGVNFTVTPTQISDFINKISAGGFSALPQMEQDILSQFFEGDPAREIDVVNLIASVNPATVPTDELSALAMYANASANLGSIYSQPAMPSAVAGLHQPIFSSDPLSVAITENGQPASETGIISFTDANSTLSPTASITAKTVSATGDGLILTDPQKTAFANAFSVDTHTGAWSFNLKGSDAAFLIPGDSVKIIETVTIDDGQGGTASQDETFTILGANESPTIISGGGRAAATYIMSEDARFITNVTATDPDRGDHVTYSIANGSKSTPLTIDPRTGALSLAHGLNSNDRSSTVTVQATDSYGASTTQTVTVDVAHAHLMVGTGAADNFVFQPHFGFEVVQNFDPNHDVLQFNNTIFANAQDLLAHAKQVQNDVVITDSLGNNGHGHDTITLTGVHLAALNASDFTFIA